MKVSRADYLAAALRLMGTPYVYGGRSREGLDCSGLPIVALYESSVGNTDLHQWWTGKFWDELEPVDAPLPGDVALYGPPEHVEHLMVVLVPPGEAIPSGVVFGACNGDSTVSTVELAKKRRARVTAKPSVSYRPGLRGFRSMARFLAA